MARQPGYYWMRLPSSADLAHPWQIGEWKKVNRWNEPEEWGFICRDLFNEGRGIIDDNVIHQLKIEINETRIPNPDETISQGEAYNLLYVLAKDSSTNTEFINHMKVQYHIVLIPKHKTVVDK